MARRSKRGPGIALPWERREGGLRRLLAGPRWKIAVLVAVLVLGLSLIAREATLRARERETRLAIDEVHRAIASFRTDLGRCPRSLTELVHPPRSRARYLRQMPRDGWGRSLLVRCPGRDDPDGADVVSAGPNGSFFTDDNIQ